MLTELHFRLLEFFSRPVCLRVSSTISAVCSRCVTLRGVGQLAQYFFSNSITAEEMFIKFDIGDVAIA
jgi:hypothetical protein